MVNLDPEKYKIALESKNENYWQKRGDKAALNLFHGVAEQVPAYKDFLEKNGVRAEKIKTIENFKNIPTLDKINYLKAYSLEELFFDGNFKKKQWVISSTSGSTGEPLYFPREFMQDSQYALIAELYLRTNFEIDKKPTLYIVAFPMGIWIGGLFTYQAIRSIAQRGGYNLSIITPGIDKNEIIRAVKKFGNVFDQIILGCYGPFLKDTIDEGIRQGVDWKKYNLKFIFSAEGFSEDFRDYVARKTGLKNIYKDTLNHYGTVDLGTMSYETPVSILIRRMAVKNKSLYNKIFPIEHKLPTLTQYIPELFYFEEANGSLLCSAQSGIPLVRYDLKDNGGIISFNKMREVLLSEGIDLISEARKAGIANTIWELPFVYVYERKDLSVSLYAFQVYPETIRKALQLKKFEEEITGKFTMLTKYNKNHDPYLEINIELKPGKSDTKKLKTETTKAVLEKLFEENSEFRKTYSETGDKLTPKLIFWPYEYSVYFKPGTKQKWAIASKNK